MSGDCGHCHICKARVGERHGMYCSWSPGIVQPDLMAALEASLGAIAHPSSTRPDPGTEPEGEGNER